MVTYRAAAIRYIWKRQWKQLLITRTIHSSTSMPKKANYTDGSRVIILQDTTNRKIQPMKAGEER